MTQALESLSEREKRILCLLALAWPDKQIARDLGITEATVKVHNKRIRRKTGLANRTAMATAMLRMQLENARADALEEAAQLAEAHSNMMDAPNHMDSAKMIGRKLRALISQPATKPAAQEMSTYGKIDMGYEG